MKDRIALLAAAVLCALLSWAFWHYLGNDAFTVLPTVGLVVFAFDNYRLRRKLRELSRTDT